MAGDANAASRKVVYAGTMESISLAPQFANDADLQALAADAVMSLSPWALYTPDKKPTAIAKRAVAILERGLQADPKHMYLCHLRIHADEMGPVEQFDWVSAENLRATDALDAGHLLHMPTHLDIQVGDYSRAIESNQLAIAADLRQLKRSPSAFRFTRVTWCTTWSSARGRRCMRAASKSHTRRAINWRAF